jgi:aminopeptidase YwaD
MKKLFCFLICICFIFPVFSQDIGYAHQVTDTLCSVRMQGRGYVNKGDSLAADFIKNEFQKNGLTSFKNNWYQPFTINVNTFPGKVFFKAGKKTLVAGDEFMVLSSCPPIKGSFKTFLIDSTNASTVDGLKILLKKDLSSRFIIIDIKGIHNKDILKVLKGLESENIFKSKGLIYIEEKKPIWELSYCQKVVDWAVVNVERKAFPKKTKKISIDVESIFKKEYTTRNVIGYIPGKTVPDSFIVFTAHYDHLGKMGNDVMFPGANDNASGVSMLCNLAKYYAAPENAPDYSIAFIATTAEEVGLLGAFYYVKNPLFSLKKIRFLVNLDLVGTGDDGIKVVNATVFEKEFALLDSLNTKNGYLKTVSKRGEAAISDHYAFYSKGVKCFYIYTLGGISEYHNPKDRPETLPFTEYSDLFKLITGFVKALE